jgi:PBSX family phage terminase large subunit
MSNFKEMNFLICGQTISALRRNLVNDWILQMRGMGFTVSERRTDNLIIVNGDDGGNYFYLFGGDNVRRRELVQGITAAGILFDEVALMEESFVSQAEGRCSVDGSKFWYNCNPENPNHWFKKKWIHTLHGQSYRRCAELSERGGNKQPR